MKLSARNQLKGTVAEVRKGQTTAHVRINVAGSMLTASITNEAVDELKLTHDRARCHQGERRHGRHRLTTAQWFPGTKSAGMRIRVC
jgi:molybdopterin-binding protein